MTAAALSFIALPATPVLSARVVWQARRVTTGDETRLLTLFSQGMSGDAQAHRAFLTETSACLRAYFRNRLRSAPEDCEDLVQETIIAIHTKRHTYDQRGPLTAWIYAIARYRLIDHVRRQKRRGIAVPVENAEDALFTETVEDAVDARRDVGQLLETLPEKQRTAIRLTKLEQKSVREAAEITGWSESDIKVSAHRGMKALATLIRAEDTP